MHQISEPLPHARVLYQCPEDLLTGACSLAFKKKKKKIVLKLFNFLIHQVREKFAQNTLFGGNK